VATVKNTGSATADQKTLVLTPVRVGTSGQLKWRCDANGGSGSTIPTKYLPSQCRQ
jgi:hypothetical protein